MIRFRWQGWRRDCVAGLIGATIAAGAFAPIGWSLVSAERNRATAVEREADAAREKEHRRVRNAMVAARFMALAEAEAKANKPGME